MLLACVLGVNFENERSLHLSDMMEPPGPDAWHETQWPGGHRVGPGNTPPA